MSTLTVKEKIAALERTYEVVYGEYMDETGEIGCSASTEEYLQSEMKHIKKQISSLKREG